jgi:hypothetical protein
MGAGSGGDQLQRAAAPIATGRAFLEDHTALHNAGLASSAARGDRRHEEKNWHEDEKAGADGERELAPSVDPPHPHKGSLMSGPDRPESAACGHPVSRRAALKRRTSAISTGLRSTAWPEAQTRATPTRQSRAVNIGENVHVDRTQPQRVDETCYIWDRAGHLVTRGLQLAGIRLNGTTPTPEAAK